MEGAANRGYYRSPFTALRFPKSERMRSFNATSAWSSALLRQRPYSRLSFIQSSSDSDGQMWKLSVMVLRSGRNMIFVLSLLT